MLSIDFEDWHQLVHRRLGFPDWDRPHAALERQTGALLDLLDELGARATFFLLGMILMSILAFWAQLLPMYGGYTPGTFPSLSLPFIWDIVSHSIMATYKARLM